MMRTLIDLPEDDMKWLDQRAAEQGKSRAALVREAVTQYRAETPQSKDMSWLDDAFGIWKDRTDIGDAVEWQRRERASWTRPWDDDYEDVKAEFPDLFDAEDDRQRQIYLDMKSGRL
ncbi:ribbon-helix-helix protein, CopG family [Sphingomonas sp. RP10(2022)]|uniref:Ribbon-helix-helix protein, CopG family n=2 Tax=Sphingomonas liriopis TaxID=2949094 RepID=A0A9X2KQ59_9SPHN|nr:ribbon-helix-helix protein, CopG family [Sphingomonas liriopis]